MRVKRLEAPYTLALSIPFKVHVYFSLLNALQIFKSMCLVAEQYLTGDRWGGRGFHVGQINALLFYTTDSIQDERTKKISSG